MAILFKQCGILTSVQDFGRFGGQKFGIGTTGAMDQRSLAIANILLGNPANTAGLEITMLGPTMLFEEDCVIAITGANLSPSVGGKPVPMYQALAVEGGSVLSFGAPRSGCRSYLAVAGGFDVPEIFGSSSTHLRAGMGGFQGRKLQRDDRLALRAPVPTLRGMEKRVVAQEDFSADTIKVRVVLGPQNDQFTEEGLNTFLSTPYQVTNESDRMGIRLDGAKITHIGDGNIISDAIAFGAIQVPTSGTPIVMMAECQTIGGYSKIAGVISADLPLLAQAKPGTKIFFQKVSIQRAQELYRLQQEAYRDLEIAVTPKKTFWEKIFS